MNETIWQPLCDKSITTDLDILYTRLSCDDGDGQESNSIFHQKEILAEFAAKNGFDRPVFVIDDGFSGSNFQRPGWQLVLQEIEAGNVRSIILHNQYEGEQETLEVRIAENDSICTVKCKPGSVNTNCPVCKLDMTQRLGEEPEPPPTPRNLALNRRKRAAAPAEPSYSFCSS